MNWSLSKRIQIAVVFSAITLVAIFLLLPTDTDIQTTKTSPIHDAIPQFALCIIVESINDANNILPSELNQTKTKISFSHQILLSLP